MQVHGNQSIYGHNHYYGSSHMLTNMILFSWLFRPHPFYYSPYGYGRYPGYWGGGYGVVSHRSYRSHTRTITSKSNYKKSNTNKLSNRASSPNKGKSASKGIRAPLKNPSKSQKSFQARNPSKHAKSGGFGKGQGRSSSKSGFGRGRSSSKSSSSVRSRGFGRSGGRFGGK